MTGSNTISKLAVALVKAQKEMGQAVKGSTNPFFKSSYADLNSIREAVTPALNANGIVVLQPTSAQGNESYVETILLHESGEYISGFTAVMNADGKPQSEGSGISYARRYGLQSILNVGAVDDDGEQAQGRQVVKEVTNARTKETKVTAVQTKPVGVHNPAPTKTAHTETGNAKDLITASFKVLEAQKQITKDAFKMNYLGNKGLSTVAPSEFPAIYEKMKKDFPQLNSNGVK